ncbi:hypothetical protein GCM10027341_21260 [Spirosoma knui]
MALTSIKFTVTSSEKVDNIIPSVGCPPVLVEPLKRAVKASEGQWITKKRQAVDCVLPVMIFPAMECPGEAEFLTLQSGAQMLKYTGEYIMFPNLFYHKYNVDMVEGIMLSPIMIRSGSIH